MKDRNNKKVVLVFGVFDELHDGHRYFLREAKKLGDRLVVAVAHDEAILKLKGRVPRQGAAARAAVILSENLTDEVIIGDSVLGEWSAIKKFLPTIVALGYDQTDLKKTLEQSKDNAQFTFDFIIVTISPYRPDKLHSRLISSSARPM